MLRPHRPIAISFRNVTFSYPSRPELTVLEGVSFDVPRNATVAFVSPLGSGKSTIIALIQRFYDAEYAKSANSRISVAQQKLLLAVEDMFGLDRLGKRTKAGNDWIFADSALLTLDCNLARGTGRTRALGALPAPRGAGCSPRGAGDSRGSRVISRG